MKTDPKGEVIAFIDDTYFIALPQAAEAGRKAYQDTLRTNLKIEENATRRKVLLGREVIGTNVPQDLAPYVVSELCIVGSEVGFARADRVPLT